MKTNKAICLCWEDAAFAFTSRFLQTLEFCVSQGQMAPSPPLPLPCQCQIPLTSGWGAVSSSVSRISAWGGHYPSWDSWMGSQERVNQIFLFVQILQAVHRVLSSLDQMSAPCSQGAAPVTDQGWMQGIQTQHCWEIQEHSLAVPYVVPSTRKIFTVTANCSKSFLLSTLCPVWISSIYFFNGEADPKQKPLWWQWDELPKHMDGYLVSGTILVNFEGFYLYILFQVLSLCCQIWLENGWSRNN